MAEHGLNWVSGVDTDATLAADSDSKLATQKAVKAYVDGHSSPSSLTKHGFAATVAPASPTFYFPPSTFAGTITGWKITTTTGSAISGTVKVWKKATTGVSAADSINTSGVSISAATDVVSTTLTDFTTLAISVGDRLAIHLESGTDPLTFALEYQ